jgi:hypothetical protein
MGTWIVGLGTIVVAVLVIVGLSMVILRGSLNQRFLRLGTLAGRREAEIVAVVGPPQARSALPGGRYLLQWMRVGYHIALAFEPDGTCIGVTHQFGR